MAIILRGKDKGKKIILHQFANNWVIDSSGKVHLVTSLLFDDEEVAQFKYASCCSVGTLWHEFELRGNKFYRIKQGTQ